MKSFENRRLVRECDLHASDNLGAHGGIGSAVGHFTEVVGNFGLRQRGVNE